MSNIEQPFKTADLGLAAYLCLKGFTVIGAVDTDESFSSYLGNNQPRKEIILVDREDREKYVEEWLSHRGDAAICFQFGKMQRIVKNVMYPKDRS